MSKYKIVNLIDQLFVSICVFLVVYAWINFYVRNLWTTFILSLIFSFAIIFILFYVFQHKQTKKINSKKKNDDITKCHLAFRLMSISCKINFLKTILEKDFDVVNINNSLIYTKNNQRHLVIIATDIEKLSQNDLINILENIDDSVTNIEIICNQYLPMKTKILKDKTITLIDKDKLYLEFFDKYKIYPDVSNIDNSISKFSWKDFFLGLFKQNKARGYFFAGFILIFSSIILPYHIYYLVFGSILLMFSITCKLLPTFKNFHGKS